MLLGLLTVLAWQGVNPDVELGSAMHQELRDFLFDEASFTRDLLSARAGLRSNYDSVVQERLRLIGHMQRLRELAGRSAAAERSEFEPLLGGLSTALDAKFDAAERFKSANALLRNSLMYLGFTGSGLDIRESERSLATALGQLSYSILRYAQAPDDRVAAEARLALERLEARPGRSVAVDTVIAHARLILRLQPQANELARDIGASTVAARAGALQQAIEEHLRRIDVRAGYYRRALYAVSVLLLAFIVHQVLRLRQAREAARRQELRLVRADRMSNLGLLVGSVAHEMKSPNQVILDNADSVARACHDAMELLARSPEVGPEHPVGGLPFAEMRRELPELLVGVRESALRIRRLVIDLLEYSGARGSGFPGASGRDPSTIRSFDVNESVRRVERIFGKLIRERTSRFVLDLAPGMPPAVGRSQDLEQVLVNLVMNSLDALADRQRGVAVRTRYDPAGRHIVLEVIDEGAGIAPENLARLCEPFFSTRHGKGGTGLGLAITNSLVQSLRGRLAFASELGKGTRATVELLAAGESSRDDSGRIATTLAPAAGPST